MSKKSKTKPMLVLTEIGRAHLHVLFNELSGFLFPKENTDESATRFLLRCGFSERSLNQLKLLHHHETDADLLRVMQCLKKEDLFRYINDVRESVLTADTCHFSELPLGHVKGVLESTISILPGVIAIARAERANYSDIITTPHPITLASVSGVFAAHGPFALWCNEHATSNPKLLETRYRLLLTDRLVTLLKTLAGLCPTDEVMALRVPELGTEAFEGKVKVRGRDGADMVKRQLDLALQDAIRLLTPEEKATFAGICLDVHACNHPKYGSPLILPALPVPYRAIKGANLGVNPNPDSPEVLLESLAQGNTVKKRVAGKTIVQVDVTASDWMAKELYEGSSFQQAGSSERAESVDHRLCVTRYSSYQDTVKEWEKELRPFLLELLTLDILKSLELEEARIGTHAIRCRHILDALYPGLGEKTDAVCNTIWSLKSQITKAKGVKYINAEDDDELRRLKKEWDLANKRLSDGQTVLQLESWNENLPNTVSSDLKMADEVLRKAEIDEKRCREVYKACQARKKEALLSQLKDAIKTLRDNWRQTVLDRVKPTSDRGSSKEAEELGVHIRLNDRTDAIRSRWEALRKEWDDVASKGSYEHKHTLVLTDIGQSHLIEFISILRSYPVHHNMTVLEAKRCLIGCGFSKRSIKQLCKLYNASSEITLLKLMKKMDKESLFLLINCVREPVTMSDKASFTTLPFGHVKGVLESTVCVLSSSFVCMSGVFGEVDPFLSLSTGWNDNALMTYYQTVWSDRFSVLLRVLAFQCADSNTIALTIPDMGTSSLVGKIGMRDKATFVRDQLESALKQSIHKLRPLERSKFACIYLGDRASYQSKEGSPTETALRYVVLTPTHWMAEELGGDQCAPANDPSPNTHLMGSRVSFKHLPRVMQILVKGLPQGVWTEETLRSYVGSSQGAWFKERYGAGSQLDYGSASQYLMEKPFGLDRDNTMSAFVLRHFGYLREYQFNVLCDVAIRAGDSREEARDRLDVRYPGLGEKADSVYTLIQRTQEQRENRKKQLIDLQNRSPLKEAWKRATAKRESIEGRMKNALGSLNKLCSDAKEEESRCKHEFEMSISKVLESESKAFQGLIDSAIAAWRETVDLFREEVDKKIHQEGGKKSRGVFRAVVPVRKEKEKDVQAQIRGHAALKYPM